MSGQLLGLGRGVLAVLEEGQRGGGEQESGRGNTSPRPSASDDAVELGRYLRSHYCACMNRRAFSTL